MTKQSNINSIVMNLKRTTDSETFDEMFTKLFVEVQARWSSGGVIPSIAFQFQITEDEAMSIALEKLHQSVKSFYDFDYEFYHYLSRSISNGCRRYKRETKEQQNEEMISNVTSMEDDPNLVEFIPHANEENEDFDNYVKKSEQRQLLALLLEKADDKSRQAVEAYSISKSYNEASKLLGISNHAVKRRVQKVAKLFNPSEYGEITDYFTVETCEVS